MLLMLSGLTPFCTFHAIRITLQVQGGGRGDARRLNPEGGPLFSTAQDWPPFVGPSLPFWFAAACLVTVMIVLSRSREVEGARSLNSPLVAYMGFLGGVWSILFALAFRDLDAWPRDSALAGAIQIICGTRVVIELVRAGRHGRKERRAHAQACVADTTASSFRTEDGP